MNYYFIFVVSKLFLEVLDGIYNACFLQKKFVKTVRKLKM